MWEMLGVYLPRFQHAMRNIVNYGSDKCMYPHAAGI